MSPPLVSILLPTRNGMATLPAVLAALRAQETDLGFEIVAIDSSSSDGSAELLAAKVDRLLTIRASEFNHGLTRNRGIEACRGDLVALLVQDAEPADRHWLDQLVRPLREDASVAGSFARQIVRPEASALTRHYLEGWLAAGATPRVAALSSPAEFASLTPMDRFQRSVFDNVSSCLRREVWRRIPFRSTPIAEDLEWGRDVLLAGHRLAFVPAARVLHSHERSAGYELRRTWLVHERLRSLFDLRTIPDLGALGRAVAASLALHRELSRGEPGSARRRAEALALAWPLGQYLGGSAWPSRFGLRPRAV